ncbi:uncharacterized protein LOC119097776 [Pollicipes pollicipes]|uniref:uncharacterized protein LOC119097776 n=1 Tax=Pollicipes pollicipes TaxID=41117 RepID=UPI00188596D5|nr:uncharacterized protein LOC119097776 [Pollicipes pollicipes]
MSQQQLDAEIAKAEQELRQLKEQLENNKSAASQHGDPGGSGSAAGDHDHSSGDPGAALEGHDYTDAGSRRAAPEPEPEPATAFADWSQQRAALDEELAERLQARLAFAETVNEELSAHAAMLERVAAGRRQFSETDLRTLLRRLADRRLEQRRLYSSVQRVLNDMLRTIHNPPGFDTIQYLMDRLLTRLRDHPSDPYITVSNNICVEHLNMLERACVIRFHSAAGEGRVRLLDLGPNVAQERIRLGDASEEAPESAGVPSPSEDGAGSESAEY